MPKTRTGVTLIELLVVFSIIALLIAISLPAFRGVWNRADDLDVQNDMKQLVLAYCNYAAANGRGPSNVQQIGPYYENNARITKAIESHQITVIWGLPALGPTTLVAYETKPDRIGNRLVAFSDGSVHTVADEEFAANLKGTSQ